MPSADFKNVTLKPVTGVFDSLSSPDEIGFGNWRLVKNATTRATRNRQRAGGWRRLFADEDPYNNQDLHDQLIDQQSYYGSYVGHAMGGMDQVGLGYPYFFPTQEGPGAYVYPPASGPICPAFYGDYGGQYGQYDDCPIVYSFAGYPYSLRPQIPGACDTGEPFFYPYSYLYFSCPNFVPGDLIDGYAYGYSFPVYSSPFAYDYIYCGDDLFFRPGCREAITALGELVLSTGRKLFAATMSRVYEYNQSSGSWRILADGLGNSGYTALQCTCNSVRGIFAKFGSYLIFANNFDPVLIYLLGSDPNECSQQAMQPISDLLALGITRAGGAIEWKGFLFIWDYEEAGERMGGNVRWSDFEDPNSFIESDDSLAGFATIAVGETVLRAEPLGNWLQFYTDRGMIRCSLVGGEDVFNFERIYTGSQSTGDALKYKYSLINAGDIHLYLGESDLWVFTQFDTRPVMVPWITKACGMIFNGITEDDATYQRINEEMCNLVTGGYNERTKEAYLSWPSGDNVCPDVTLRFNLKFATADLVDHGFTAFQTFRKELRPTFGQWLEDLGICERGTQVATGPRDGPICAGNVDEVANPPLYMRNPTENANLPVHPDSLCARLQGKTLDDFCRDCAAPDTFIMASAADFTLKQWEDDFYYRERLRFVAPPCDETAFDTPIVLDQWYEVPSVNCAEITVKKLVESSSEVPPFDLLTSLVTVWHFDSGTNIFVADYCAIPSSNCVLTPIFPTTTSPGKLDDAVDIPSGLQLVESELITDFMFTGGVFTFSLWVKFASFSATEDDIISKTDPNKGYILRVDAVGNVSFFTGTGVGFDGVSWGTPINLGQWYHIVCGRDGSKIYLQVNSESVFGTMLDAPSAIFDDALSRLKSPENIPGGVYQMDELLVWEGRFLSGVNERSALWNNGAGLAWPFSI